MKAFELETFNMRDGSRTRTVYVDSEEYREFCRKHPEKAEGNVLDTLARMPKEKRR